MNTAQSNRPATATTTTYFLGRPATTWRAGLQRKRKRPTRQD
jgi:hypothetical protein